MFISFLVALVLIVGSIGMANAAAITSLVFGASFAASIGGQLVSLAIGMGISYLSRRLFGQNQSGAAQSDPTQISYGERVSRQGIFGRQLVAGHRVHYNEFDDAKKAQLVHVLADHWCDGLESVFVNGRQYDLVEVAGPYVNNEVERYQVAEFGALIDIRFHDGRPGQLADTEIISQTPGWDASRKYAGLCYVAITITSDKEKFNGLPEMQFVVRGARLYDPRKDSSLGGVGAHRFDDPFTWAYSANCAVQAYHFTRGFHFAGQRVLGAGLSAIDLDLAGCIAAMNVCDEQVQRPDGSWRNRYESHLTWQDTDDHAPTLRRLCEAMGGTHGERQGQLTFFPGKLQTPVMTLTDVDLPTGTSISYSPRRDGVFLHSGAHGTYTHSKEFSAAPYQPYEPQAYLDADGQSRLMRLDFDQVQDPHQGYLLVKQNIDAARLEATARVTVDVKDIQLEGGDWVIWASSDPMIGTKTWLIERAKPLGKGALIELQLRQIDGAVFTDDATAEQVAEPPRERPFFGYQKDVFGFGVEAVAVSGSGGENLPALKFTYNPITDPAIRGLKVEYRIAGDENPTLFKATDTSAGDGEFYSSDGVMPGLTYEARVILDAVPGREVNWTNWVPIAVPTGPMQVISPESIDYSHLAQDLSNTVGVLNATGAGSLQATLDYIINELERFASEVTGEHANALIQRQLLQVKVGSALSQILTESTLRANGDTALADLLSIVSAEVDDNAAAILQEQTARANADGALATSLNETIAAMGDSFAQGLFKIDAVATGGGAEATMKMMVRAANDDGWIESGILLVAKDDGTSQIALVAEETVIVNSNGDLLGMFGSDGVINAARIPVLNSDKINVTKLSAIAANLGTITAMDGITVGPLNIDSGGTIRISD